MVSDWMKRGQWKTLKKDFETDLKEPMDKHISVPTFPCWLFSRHYYYPKVTSKYYLTNILQTKVSFIAYKLYIFYYARVKSPNFKHNTLHCPAIQPKQWGLSLSHIYSKYFYMFHIIFQAFKAPCQFSRFFRSSGNPVVLKTSFIKFTKSW